MEIAVIWIAAIAIRAMLGLWGYSGAGKPPMFGDFEAQRHWLEVTVSLPIGDWYRNTTDNDLLYWGLDYPPLTAYVSCVFGMISKAIYPPLVELYSSRGHESVEGKYFMRWSVILCDLLIFFPAIACFVRKTTILLSSQSPSPSSSLSPSSTSNSTLKTKRFWCELLCLLTPSLLLIDHGHFQYNAVCIGLTLLAAALILNDHIFLGSVFFCLSLNFKQMALYYSPVFFFALLRTCFYPQTSVFGSLLRLSKLGIAVIGSFALLWMPFCLYPAASETCLSSLTAVLVRLFPFNRGLFEDKVANLWYLISVIVDIRAMFPVDLLAKFSLLLTLVLISPVCANLLLKPLSSHRLVLALIACSLSFFLASFQVHEKSLLLPLVPSMLLLATEPVLVGWFQVLGCFTMFPLLIRDGHRISYFAVIAGFLSLLAISCDATAKNAQQLQEHNQQLQQRQKQSSSSPSSMQSPSPVKKGSHSHLTDSAASSHRREIVLVTDETVPLSPQQQSAANTTERSNERHIINRSKGIGFWLLSNQLKWLIAILSTIGMVALHVMEVLLPPPARLPDLYPALFSLYGVANLLVVYLVTVMWLWTLPDDGDDVAVVAVGVGNGPVNGSGKVVAVVDHNKKVKRQ